MSRMRDRLLLRIKRANKKFNLIEPNDHVMVCLSGGKDSYTLLDLLAHLRPQLPFSFTMVAVNLDQGHPGFPAHILENWLREEGHDYRMLHRDTLSIVKEKLAEGSTYCSLCARLRRGILYSAAEELGATKIALGHHRDDLLETTLLNLFYSGKLATMPPRLHADDGKNVVIRPLVYCAEEDIATYAGERGFPILPCGLCGSQDNLKRQEIKRLLATLEADNPTLRGTMLAALGNVSPSHLLDGDLWDVGGRGALDSADAPLWD